MKAAGQALVTLQFALLGAWIAAGPWLAVGAIGLGVQGLGLALAGWAFVVMSVAQGRLFRIAPDPAGHTRLVDWGPYRRIRHPMYAAILLVVGPPWLAAGSLWRTVGWAALLLTLVAKLTVEEHLLQAHFEGYADYRRRSWRLLPGVF